MGFFQRIKKGYKKAGEYKEKFEKYQDERAEKAVKRAEIRAKQYKAQAEMYKAAAARNKARQASAANSGFGMQSNDMGFFQRPAPAAAPMRHRKRMKKKGTTRRRYSKPMMQKPQGIRGLDYL